MELEKFESVKTNAIRLFPRHLEITFLAFKKAKTRYFALLKPMPILQKILYFEKTYYCHNNICWFILDNNKYFSIHTDVGSFLQCNYYGTLTL